jgi:hypothetical protein
MKVFISYKWENGGKDTRVATKDKWVTRLAYDLNNNKNIKCLFDKFETPEYPAQFAQRMRDCDVVVVIMTKESVAELNSDSANSNFCYEVNIAITLKNKGKLKIIPILKDDIEPAVRLSPFLFIDFTDDNHYSDNINYLTDIILQKNITKQPVKIDSIRVPISQLTDGQLTNYIRGMGHHIHKLKSKDSTNRWAYYFILVPPENEDSFLNAIKGEGIIDLEDYGKVIASSYGETPTIEVRDYLKEKYGFNV